MELKATWQFPHQKNPTNQSKPPKKSTKRCNKKSLLKQYDEWNLLYIFTEYVFPVLSKKFLWVARKASLPVCLVQAGAEWVNANPSVGCWGAPSQTATQQGRIGLGGEVLLYSIMEEQNERKHIGWSLRSEQMSCQTQDSGQEAFPTLRWSVYGFFCNKRKPLKVARLRTKLDRCRQNSFLHFVSPVLLDGFCIFMRYLVRLGVAVRLEMYFL